MDLISWNCNMAFRKKSDKILRQFNPDIMVIQECEHPSKINLSELSYHYWVGENKNKGLCAFSKSEIDIISLENSDSKYFIYFRVEKKLFLAVWAMNDEQNKNNRYIGQIYNIISSNLNIFKEDLIVLGDFNWNIKFDNKPSYTLSGNFNDVINIFKKKNLHSGYHAFYNEKYGEESKATFYMHKKCFKPYHIDYIFLNKLEIIQDLMIGDYEDWVSLSDHMPIYVKI